MVALEVRIAMSIEETNREEKFMSKILRSVLLIVVLVAGSILSSAQVELNSEIVLVEEHEIYSIGSDRDGTIADYLLLTLKDEACASIETQYTSSYPVLVCVFEDPTTGDLIHYTGLNRGDGVLFISGNIAFLTFHEGEIVRATDNYDTVLTNLAPGDWKVEVYHSGVLESFVTFTIEDVELHSEIVPVEEHEIYSVGSRDDKTIVDFLLVTVQEQYCAIADIYHDEDYSNDPVIVCVFENPMTGEPILHAGLDRGDGVTGSSSSVMYLIFHEGQLVHVTDDTPVLTDLAPGDWKVDMYRSGVLKAFVTFTITVPFSIGDAADTPASEPEIAESITLETPESGTTWQKAEKHEMKSGCNVAYGLIDFDTPAIAVVLKGEPTIRQVTSTELYGNHKTPLTPVLEEEGDWQGWLASISAYFDPQHRQQYKLHYEQRGKTYEVNFRYESGITGSRKVAAAIVIEC